MTKPDPKKIADKIIEAATAGGSFNADVAREQIHRALLAFYAAMVIGDEA